jgi:hypothetical protein
MHKVFSTLLVLLTALGSSAADLKLPANVRGDPGTFVQVQANTSGTTVRWYVLDPGLNLFPVNLLKDTKTAVVTGTAPGAYRLLAYTSDKDGPSDPAVCTVTIGPPGPGPGPVPPQPTPTDPFTQALQAAYAKDTDANKSQEVQFLAGVYQGAPALLTPDVTTAGALFNKLMAAIHAPGVGLPKGAIPQVAKVIDDDLSATFGTIATAPLDAAKAKAVFSKYAAALGTLK